MDTNFYPLTLQSIIRETPNCVQLIFSVPTAFKDKFAFIQGQYITLKALINGKEERRSYSICSCAKTEPLSVAIKKVPNGIFSTWANTSLKVGDVIEAMMPNGKFYTNLALTNQYKYVAFAAGSGITPILSLIKTTLCTELQSTFTLVYSNKNIENIIFKEALEALKNKYPQRFNIVYIFSQQRADTLLNFGRINTEKLQQLSKIIQWNSVTNYFICGPEEMIFCVRDFLYTQMVPKNKIHFELFTTGKKTTSHLKIENDTLQSTVFVKKDGRVATVKINPSNPLNILDAALQQGSDLPYACKGGVCCTCKAKLVKGTVNMEVHWGLEEFEIEQGYILTCQSYPTSNEVEIDFDI